MAKFYIYKKNFALERGGPKRLRVLWSYGFREVKIEFDGVEVGVIKNAHKSREGNIVTLPNGLILHIKKGKHPIWWNPLPAMKIKDQVIPGSADDPEWKIIAAYNVFLYLGIANFGGAVYIQFTNPNLIPVLAINVIALMGLLAIVTALLIKSRSKAGFQLGILVVMISLMVGLYNMSNLRGFDLVEAIYEFFDTFLFAVEINGAYKAMELLKKQAALSPI